jgi:arylsulfatase A-like enzyme
MTLNAVNVLNIIGDDIARYVMAAFGANPFQPPTPTLTALAAGGVRFQNFCVTPVCSSTRGSALTGRRGFRNGLPGLVDNDDAGPLPIDEIIIPRALQLAGGRQIDTALIGKNHISDDRNGKWLQPTAAGFGTHKGSLRNLRKDGGTSHYNWARGVDGRVALESTYSATKQTDDAIAWINAHGTTQNWLCWLAYNIPHNPHDRPPAASYTVNAYSAYDPAKPYPLPNASPIPNEDQVPYYLAAVQTLDSELARLFAGITPAIYASTLVLFWPDNGTTPTVVTPPFNPDHSKFTVYEQGTNVGMIASGAGIVAPGRVYTGLVDVVDIFSTILDVYGVDVTKVIPAGRTIDGVSFKSVLANTGSSSRTRSFTELFEDNVPYPDPATIGSQSQRAWKDATYKLIVKYDEHGTRLPDEFYNWAVDPNETNNLLAGTLSAPEQAAYATLQAELAAYVATV